MANTKIPSELSSTPSISDSGDATAITITSDEKVGIGTTPDSTRKLHVKDSSGNAYRAVTIEADNANADAGLEFIGGGNNVFNIQQPHDSAGLFFYDRTNSVERLRISSSGEIQVGTFGQIKFAATNVGAPNTSNHTTGTRIAFYDANATSWYAMGIESGALWFNSDQDYKFYRDGSEQAKLDNDGNFHLQKSVGSKPITSCSGFSGVAGAHYLIQPSGCDEPVWAEYSGDNYKSRGKGYFKWWHGYGDGVAAPNTGKVIVNFLNMGFKFYEVIVEDMANTTYPSSAPAWEYAYWNTLQTFNTKGMNTDYATSSGVGNGTVRAMWGNAGGHGLYDTTIGGVCSWGNLDANAVIGSGFDGSCGTYGNGDQEQSPVVLSTGISLKLGRPNNSAYFLESTGAFKYWFNF